MRRPIFPPVRFSGGCLILSCATQYQRYGLKRVLTQEGYSGTRSIDLDIMIKFFSESVPASARPGRLPIHEIRSDGVEHRAHPVPFIIRVKAPSS
jgi:hypothetical protein